MGKIFMQPVEQQMQRFMMRVKNLSTRQVLAILVGIAVFSAVFSAFKQPGSLSDEWWSGFAQNFSTEMFGAIATFVLIEGIIGNRQDKQRLIIQMRSRDNAIAQQAVYELRENGGLYDGSLQGANLSCANLKGAALEDANLRGTNLFGANLKGANLFGANLEGTNLVRAHLERAGLFGANLKGANLMDANLEWVRLDRANLEGTNLVHARLGRAGLFEAKFYENTTLPDGTQWTPDTDMTHFTNPNHPDFWRREPCLADLFYTDDYDKPNPPSE